ncbi:MAG: bestrophin family ion channel [Pseudanabaena sp. ELA607]
MLNNKRYQWFRVAIQLDGSVIFEVMPRVIFCGLFGVIISLVYQQNQAVSLPFLSTVIPNVVLGLLLVFRTNTAYERFWEGRRVWGILVNSIRNLTRQILASVDESNDADRQQKLVHVRLLAAFAISLKLQLRHEPMGDELKPFLSPFQHQRLQTMNNPPLEIAFWLSIYLQNQFKCGLIKSVNLHLINLRIHEIVDVVGACERIQRTPIPLAYSIHLKQLLLIYCLSLPFQLVGQLGHFTGIGVALISFTLLGVEEIGLQIEDPFGRDANDLPLDTICKNIVRNMEDLIAVSSDVALKGIAMTGLDIADIVI